MNGFSQRSAMAINKILEEVWRWKEEVAQDTEHLTTEEQIEYFHNASRDFLGISIPPLESPMPNNASANPISS
jgi:hypothetical protein